MPNSSSVLQRISKPFTQFWQRWQERRERALPRRRTPASVTLLRIALVLIVIACVLALWGYGYAVMYRQADRSVQDLSTRWARAPSQFVAVDDMQVHVRAMGPSSDPTPIVMLHDDGSSLYTWSAWMQGLSATRRVVALDLPGYGLTGPSPTASYGLLSEAGFVSRTLDALQIKRCQLIGNGWGGEVAQMVAVLHPDQVAKLVLISPSGYATNRAPQRFIYDLFADSIFNPISLQTLNRADVAAQLRLRYGHPERVTQDQIDRDFELRLREGNRQALLDIAQRRDTTLRPDQVQQLQMPILILWGGLDAIQPQEQAYWQQRDMRGSTVVVLDDLGHFPQEEDPPASLQPVLSFLSQP